MDRWLYIRCQSVFKETVELPIIVSFIKIYCKGILKFISIINIYSFEIQLVQAGLVLCGQFWPRLLSYRIGSLTNEVYIVWWCRSFFFFSSFLAFFFLLKV